MPFPDKLLRTPVGGQGPVKSLTQHQWDCVNKCDEHFNKEGLVLPVGQGKKETAPLTEREKLFLSREAYLRFLIAAGGDISACVVKLEKAIVWRRQHQIDDFDHWVEKMKFDSDMGKTFLCHFSPDGRPLLYMLCNRDQLPMSKRHPWLVLFCVERATELMANGQTALINIFPFIKKQGLPASVSVSRVLMSSLGNYYPEVLSRSYVLDAPWQIRTFIGLVWPVIDWSARRKIKICPAETIHKDGEVPTAHLLKDAGGELDVPWDAEAYWDTLLKTCRERREEHLRRWRDLGARCGLEERLFKVVEQDPSQPTDGEPSTPGLAPSISDSVSTSTDSAFTPPAMNAYTHEHGIKQWKDNWSFHGTKSSPTSVRPNMTSTSLESQYAYVQSVPSNTEQWLSSKAPPPSSLTAQQKDSIRQAEADALSNSSSTSSGLSMAGRAPKRNSSLRAPVHHPHANGSKINASSWTLESEEAAEPQPRLYPRPPPPRSQKSFTSTPSPPRERVRTSSLEAAGTKVTTRPLYRHARLAASKTTTEAGYPYRSEPALSLQPPLSLQPRTQSRPKSREIELEGKITDTLPAGEPVSDLFSPSAESDIETESESEPNPDAAPDGMDAFTSRAHLADHPPSCRSSISTLASTSDGGHSEYLSSVSSQPRDAWGALIPSALNSTSHLALEEQLEAQLQAQLAMEDNNLKEDDRTIRGSDAASLKSFSDASTATPTRHQVKAHTSMQSISARSTGEKRSPPLRGPRSPPRSPSRYTNGFNHRDSISGVSYLESPPRLPQVQLDSWRFNSPAHKRSHPSWSSSPRGGGQTPQASS